MFLSAFVKFILSVKVPFFGVLLSLISTNKVHYWTCFIRGYASIELFHQSSNSQPLNLPYTLPNSQRLDLPYTLPNSQLVTSFIKDQTDTAIKCNHKWSNSQSYTFPLTFRGKKEVSAALLMLATGAWVAPAYRQSSTILLVRQQANFPWPRSLLQHTRWPTFTSSMCLCPWRPRACWRCQSLSTPRSGAGPGRRICLVSSTRTHSARSCSSYTIPFSRIISR